MLRTIRTGSKDTDLRSKREGSSPKRADRLPSIRKRKQSNSSYSKKTIPSARPSLLEMAKQKSRRPAVELGFSPFVPSSLSNSPLSFTKEKIDQGTLTSLGTASDMQT
jgi:hypothetical protein